MTIGKEFENKVKQILIDTSGVSIDRLPDQVSGFRGSTNICDFMVFKYPYLHYLECKSIKKDYFPLSNISEIQFEGMLEKSKIFEVRGGVLIWFVDYKKLYYADIRVIDKLKLEGEKSIKFKTIHNYDVTEIKCIGRGLYPKFNGEQFMVDMRYRK